MIFHGNRLLASYFFQKLRKMLQHLSSAAVVIGALRVKLLTEHHLKFLSLKQGCKGPSTLNQNATLLEITCHGSYVSSSFSVTR